MKKKNIEEMFNYCPNYDQIINSNDTDEFLSCLVDKYKKIIFSLDADNLNHLEKAYKLDKIMFQVVDDCHFKKQLKQTFKENEINIEENGSNGEFLANLFDFDNNYLEYSYKNLENTVWV